jgi:Cu-Zn family superoxide dismutase
MRNRIWTAVVATLAIVIGALSYHAAQSQTGGLKATRQLESGALAHEEIPKVEMAVAVVHPLGENKVKGKVTFTQKEGGVEIVAELTGLTPGEHGFHVHEFGDCSMADGKCAGGHFNPTGAPHGGPDSAERHAGDLGNIKAGADGKATYKRLDKMVSLNGRNSVIGRSVIIHAKADDLKTQPSGDAGDRIGCGTIGIADPKMHAGH